MIELTNVAIAQDGRTLFNTDTIQLHKGQTIGVTGNNGTGKSTLFAALLGLHPTEQGTISVPKDWQMAHMAQEVKASDISALDYVLSGDDEWHQIHTKLVNQDALAQDEIARLYEHYDAIDGYRTPARAGEILFGLGFGQHEHQNSVASFSGGWRMRLNLARTLMARAEVLLLDEPTNHLDLDAILWLEAYLASFNGLCLIISHDQAFLDALCSHIWHIEQGHATLYTGNYARFLTVRAERLAEQAHAYQKQQAARAHLASYIERFRAKATKAKQAQSRLKQLNRMNLIAPVLAESQFSFAFFAPEYMSSPLIRLDDADIGYTDSPILHRVTLHLTPDSRLGVLGANGAGKSTLIKALVGKLTPLSGSHATSDTLKLGYFGQHQMDVLDDEATPMILLRRLAGTMSDERLRAFLGGFDFGGDKLDTPCGLFSGGERARLTLALIVWQRPNVLILDEPTNHLDIAMQNALTLALQNFGGAVVLVSHDRELITSVCDTLILVADGRVTEFHGDMDDYANHLKNTKKLCPNPATTSDQHSLPPANKPTALSKEAWRKLGAQNRAKTAPLQRTIAKLETAIETISADLAAIADQLSDSTLYDDTNKAALLALMRNQADLKSKLEAHETQLLDAMDALEQLEHSLRLG